MLFGKTELSPHLTCCQFYIFKESILLEYSSTANHQLILPLSLPGTGTKSGKTLLEIIAGLQLPAWAPILSTPLEYVYTQKPTNQTPQHQASIDSGYRAKSGNADIPDRTGTQALRPLSLPAQISELQNIYAAIISPTMSPSLLTGL